MATSLSALIALVPDAVQDTYAMRMVDIPAAGLQSRNSRPPGFNPEAEEDRAEAVDLGRFSVFDRRGMRQEAMNSPRTTGARIPNLPNPIRNLSGGQRQCRAIARATTFDSKPTTMDEPTAVPGVPETAQAENIIRAIREAGEPLILISRDMLEVFDLIERIVAFFQSRMVANAQGRGWRAGRGCPGRGRQGRPGERRGGVRRLSLSHC